MHGKRCLSNLFDVQRYTHWNAAPLAADKDYFETHPQPGRRQLGDRIDREQGRRGATGTVDDALSRGEWRNCIPTCLLLAYSLADRAGQGSEVSGNADQAAEPASSA